MEIQAHDPHHQAERDLQEKGLSQKSVGLMGGTILAISSVAPAYTLTATIGLQAGAKVPLIFLAGFLPMFFVQLGLVQPCRADDVRVHRRAVRLHLRLLGGTRP